VWTNLEYFGIGERVIEKVDMLAQFEWINNEVLGACWDLNEASETLIRPIGMMLSYRHTTL